MRHLVCFVIYPTPNDTAGNNPVQGVPAQRECPAPLPPQASSGLITAFCSWEGSWTETFPQKSHEVSFGSVGWSRQRIQKMGSEEAGAGNRTVSSRSGQRLDQIKVHCETAPQRQCAHNRWTPQSCHSDIPNGCAKFRPREKWLSTFSNAFLLKGSIKVTNNSAIPNANEERDSNKAWQHI